MFKFLAEIVAVAVAVAGVAVQFGPGPALIAAGVVGVVALEVNG